MPPRVRPARPDEPEVPELLYVSAAPYYDAFTGSAARSRRLLAALYPRAGHTASFEVCLVAELDGRPVGVLAAFPARESDPMARRFLRLAIPRLPPVRWVSVMRHLRASSAVTPLPPADSLYVDALAVAERARRRGVARALLEAAEGQARERGLTRVALDTGLENAGAQALYDALGFTRTGERRTADERSARAIGGRGFVSFVRPAG